MGEKEAQTLQFRFNRRLKVAFQGSRVTSEPSLSLVRDVAEPLGLGKFVAEHLSDSRQGLATQFRLPDSPAALGLQSIGRR